MVETGLLCCVYFCGLPGNNCPGKINIPLQNPNWPITLICLVCCCYPSKTVYCEIYTAVYCELYTVYCEIYAVNCKTYTVYCEICSVYYEIYTVYCEIYTVYYEIYTEYCELYTV